MQNSSDIKEFYEQQAQLAAAQLDFGLPLTTCEAEVRDGINSCFQPFPEARKTDELENSVYQFNKILDSLGA
ncbi:hypothetical protein ACF3DV_20250 [Chlorogloeopsis fritschii PCC 9212]|jgi:hypothetical protein|uniref:Uncharacterized protein n=1 Tax=Chlorogloeopsis fritschii PCC 6912 TaxID=211165 RepID=A0A433NN47_CHLFR|nr:hypothetical protein [Chlorogloeopsis fritschii]RUR84634.1 hypothetical protein PCC6912_15290 [Chlorogloeopsis fritschii PCC 6912]